MSYQEQADGTHRGRHNGWGRHIKRASSRNSRHKAKTALKYEEEPDTHGKHKYRGWES